jgi:hypothetical protein
MKNIEDVMKWARTVGLYYIRGDNTFTYRLNYHGHTLIAAITKDVFLYKVNDLRRWHESQMEEP